MRQETGIRKLTGTEFAVKLFARHLLQVRDHKRPQVQDVVPRVTIPLLDDDHVCGSQ